MISTTAWIGIVAVVAAIGGIVAGLMIERRAWTRRIWTRHQRTSAGLPRLQVYAAAQAERIFARAPAPLVGEALRAAGDLERARGRRDAFAHLIGTGTATAVAQRAPRTAQIAEGAEDGTVGHGYGDGEDDGTEGTVVSRVQAAFERNGGIITTRVGGRTE